MDFDSKYVKLWVWLTYTDVRSVWKPLICNFFPWQLTPDVRYLTEKVLVQYIQHLKRSYASLYHGFWLKICKIMGLVDICRRSKCVKAINLQFLPLTVDSWCQISHRKKFWCNISRIWNAVMHHYIMDFDSKYPKLWVLVDICKRSKCVKAINLQFLPWQLTPDVRYLTAKVLVQYIQHFNAVMHHDIMDFDSKYPKWWVWLTYAKRWSVWKPLICNFFPDSWLLMSDISHKRFGAIYPAFVRSYTSLYHGFWLKISKMMCLVDI